MRLTKFLLFILLGQTALAATDSSMSFDLNYLSGADAAKTTLGNPGYSIEFQTGSAGPWLRSEYGATIEKASGSLGNLIAGSILAGGSIAHRAGNRLIPFIGADAILGWANYSGTLENANGFLYGGMVSAGAEIAIKNGSSNRFAVLVKTGYRVLNGSVGTITGSNLSAVFLGIGLAWSDGGGGSGADLDL